MASQEELFERKSEKCVLGPGAVALLGFAHPIASEFLIPVMPHINVGAALMKGNAQTGARKKRPCSPGR
jgi:hypothetical protein